MTAKPKVTVDYLAEYNRTARPQDYDPNNNTAPYYQKAFDAFVDMPDELKKPYVNWPTNFDDAEQALLEKWLVSNTLAFGHCNDPVASFTIVGEYFYEALNTYYVPWDEELTIDASESHDPDRSSAADCNGYSCDDEPDLIRGIKKFKWTFGDGQSSSEMCGSADDGNFDAETEHIYTCPGSNTLELEVTDADADCSSGCSAGIKSDSLDVSIVRPDIVMDGLGEAAEDDPGGYISGNDDDDNGNCVCDCDETTVLGEDDDDLVAVSLTLKGNRLHGGQVFVEFCGYLYDVRSDKADEGLGDGVIKLDLLVVGGARR